MIGKTLYIILISSIPLNVYSQYRMTKPEIYKYWIETSKYLDDVDFYKTGFDSMVVNYIDNLKVAGIDTIGAYSLDYVGYFTSDTCKCGIIPWVAYVQWTKKGKTFHQKITKCCHFKSKIIGYSVLIKFYTYNKKNIDNERIMPIIHGATKGKNGDIILDMAMIDHTEHYSIYCYLNGHSKFTTFEPFYLEKEDNIFYSDNINSTIINWQKLIENQINEMDQ